MLTWALIFFVVSIVAGALGFSGIAGASAGIAQFLFMVFLIGAIIFAIIGYTAVKKTDLTAWSNEGRLIKLIG